MTILEHFPELAEKLTENEISKLDLALLKENTDGWKEGWKEGFKSAEKIMLKGFGAGKGEEKG